MWTLFLFLIRFSVIFALQFEVYAETLFPFNYNVSASIQSRPPTKSKNHQNSKTCKLISQNFVMVTCKFYENMGQHVDALSKNYASMHDFNVMLKVENCDFPNQTMQTNWYTGQIDVHKLYFKNCKLTLIEPNVFNTKVFINLNTLMIYDNQNIEYKSGMLNGLRFLKELFLNGASFTNINVHLLEPVKKSLEFIDIADAFHTNFGNMLEVRKLSRLQIIQFQNNVGPFKVLAPSNFSGLSIIRTLMLTSCGIEVILEKTFDFIGETLKELNLYHNRLTAINFDDFRVFVESPGANKYLELYHNSIICDCQFYKLRNLTTLIFRNEWFHLRCHARISPTVENGTNSKCKGTQEIHTKNICLKHEYYEMYAYPAFQMNIDGNGMLRIRNAENGTYRLWIQNINNKELKTKAKCPNIERLSESVKCLILRNETANISITEYIDQSEFTVFCVIYIASALKMWPLHCVAIHEHQSENDLSGLFRGIIIGFIVVLILGGVVIIGFLMGVFAIIVCKIWQRNIRAKNNV